MADKQYHIKDIRWRSADLLTEAAAGVSIVVQCQAVSGVLKVYNRLNVQRFRTKRANIRLHKDEDALTVTISVKEVKPRKARKAPRPVIQRVEAPRPVVEAPPSPEKPAFVWRKPRDAIEGDVFYFCDADARGFFVPADVVPTCCPYCGSEDAFARDGEIPAYLRQAKKERRARGETVIAPSEESGDE